MMGNQTRPNSVAIGAGELISNENDIILKSLSLKAAEELLKRPRAGRTYSAITAQVERIKERLEELSASESSSEDSLDEALEIADGATMLRILGKSNNDIESAGQLAKRGAHLLKLAIEMLDSAEKHLEMSKDLVRRRYEHPPLNLGLTSLSQYLPNLPDTQSSDQEKKI